MKNINLKSLAALIDETGLQVAAEMIDMFVDETEQRLQRMLASRQAANWSALAYDAHILGSSAAQFGGCTLSNRALRLEKQILSGDFARAEKGHRILIAKSDVFMKALKLFRANLGSGRF